MRKVEKTKIKSVVVTEDIQETGSNLNYFSSFYSGTIISITILSLIIITKLLAFLSNSINSFALEKKDLVIIFWSFLIVSFIVFVTSNNIFREK